MNLFTLTIEDTGNNSAQTKAIINPEASVVDTFIIFNSMCKVLKDYAESHPVISEIQQVKMLADVLTPLTNPETLNDLIALEYDIDMDELGDSNE